MLRITDPEYKNTRLIKLNKQKMDSKFDSFALWINQKYAVEILNIYTDTLEENTLRLQLIFEFESDRSKFFLKDRFTSSIRMKNDISKKYKKLVEPLLNQNILVLFYAFEPLAKEEANTKIPSKTIQAFKEKHKDVLWEVSRFGEHTSFFFNTQPELNRARKSGKTNELKEEYFKQLKHFDEFSYFNLANFNAVFDSKESFDKNYNGSWRAYYS